MSNVIISPNMSLPVPITGAEAGPQYAIDITNCFTVLDQHTHNPGSGAQITPLAMNINTGLSFNGNFANHLAGLTLSAQSSMPASNTIYESGNDLYWVDGVNNNVRLTQSGSVAGTPGSISNLVAPASASYQSVGAKFVWQSNTGIAANMDIASLVLRNISPNSTFGVTVAPPAALGNDYTITLPVLPASNLPLSINNSGTMTAAQITGAQIANTTITAANMVAATITSSQIANATIVAANIVANTITASQIANGTITTTQIGSNTINQGNINTSFINSGTYAPTLTSSTNIYSLGASTAGYCRVGGLVTVQGAFTFGVTSAATDSSFNISLPVNSNIGATSQASGIGINLSGAADFWTIYGGGANYATVRCINPPTDGGRTINYTFSYQVV